MQPNTFPDVANIIDTSSVPILILVISEGCENGLKPEQQQLEQKLQEHPTPVVYYTMCIPEHLMGFPRAQTPTLYYFLPKNQTPVFWRFAIFNNTLNDDLNIITKMMTGLTYEQARFTPEEQETILKVDYFLEQEKETLHKFPSVFQQARNLAKEMWKTGKNAAKGLPVIVPTEVGFERMNICQSCDKLEKDAFRCTECGCFMKTKTQLASASCPLNKWAPHV
jgi:hypothetical protein